MLCAATVHFPYMTAWPERASAADREATRMGFARIREAFEQAGIHTLVVLTSEHIVNLQPRMAPAFVVGTGRAHAAFPEPHFQLNPVTRPGAPDIATHLVRHLYDVGFDPAHSSQLQLDHGTTLPLQQIGIPDTMRVVPLLINTLFPPLPTLARCRALGEAVAQALSQEPGVAVLATGGISHTVGAPGMERNDTDFDRAFVTALAEGDLTAATAYDDRRLDALGNGTHEIRSWIAAAAAAGSARAEVLTSIEFAEGWSTGVHQMLWRTA